jgi:hypothetical protein
MNSSLTLKSAVDIPYMAKLKTAAEDRSPTSTLPRWSKVAISVFVTVHMAAVVAPPLAFICSSRGSESPIAGPLARFVQPYCQAIYLNHGYAFFAPDPGPNHLVDYKVEFSEGKPAITGRFPNLRDERPRLLYHRYFMLSEALNTRFAPPEFAPEPSPPPLTASAAERERYQVLKKAYETDREVWKHSRKQYEAMRASIEGHLKHQFGGEKVRITRIEHRPADPDEIVIERRTLDAKDTYREMSETITTGRPTSGSPANGGGQ